VTPAQRPTRHVHARARAAVSCAFVAQGIGFGSVLTHLPTFADLWTLDDLAITAIMFGVAVLAGCGSLIAAVSAGRSGSGATLRIGLLVAALGLVLIATAPTLPVFLAGIAIYGLALGLIDATSNMQAVALEAEYGRSILTSFHGAWSVGGILGALATAGTQALGWPLAAALAPIAVVPFVVAFAPFLRATGPDPAPAAVPVGAGPDPVPWRALALLGTALVLFFVADAAASSWSTLYLKDVLLATAAVAPLAYGAYQGASLLVRLFGDRVVRRHGAVPVVRTASVVGVCGLLLVIAAPGPPLAIVGFAVLGAGISVVAPLTFAAAGRLAGPDPGRRQRIDALVARLNQFNYVGFVLGGVLTGIVGSGSGLRWGFVVPLVCVALILPLARAFAPRPAGARVAVDVPADRP